MLKLMGISILSLSKKWHDVPKLEFNKFTMAWGYIKKKVLEFIDYVIIEIVFH